MSLFLLKDPLWSRDFVWNGDNFDLNLQVEHFKPEDISIKLTEDNTIIVEGKHGEKKDEHGSISRHFVKKCSIPKGYDVSKMQARFYSDGILTVSAPKIKDKSDEKVRNIPVVRVKGDSVALKSKL